MIKESSGFQENMVCFVQGFKTLHNNSNLIYKALVSNITKLNEEKFKIFLDLKMIFFCIKALAENVDDFKIKLFGEP